MNQLNSPPLSPSLKATAINKSFGLQGLYSYKSRFRKFEAQAGLRPF